MQGFKSAGSAQRFFSVHAAIGKNTPSLRGIGPADMARSRRRGVSPTCQQICYVLNLAMRQIPSSSFYVPIYPAFDLMRGVKTGKEEWNKSV